METGAQFRPVSLQRVPMRRVRPPRQLSALRQKADEWPLILRPTPSTARGGMVERLEDALCLRLASFQLEVVFKKMNARLCRRPRATPAEVMPIPLV
jgi:hypothetical protein